MGATSCLHLNLNPALKGSLGHAKCLANAFVIFTTHGSKSGCFQIAALL